MPMMTALQASSFREAVTHNAMWEGVETDADEILQKIDDLMVVGAPWEIGEGSGTGRQRWYAPGEPAAAQQGRW